MLLEHCLHHLFPKRLGVESWLSKQDRMLLWINHQSVPAYMQATVQASLHMHNMTVCTVELHDLQVAPACDSIHTCGRSSQVCMLLNTSLQLCLCL